MQPAEPTLAALPNPLLRFFLATRPPFLSVTLFAALIGLASAYASGVPLKPLTAILTVVFALVAHAGVNVLNDYYDALNGTDALNTERVFPFTGGSRFIQNGVLTMTETAVFGAALFGVTFIAGVFLTGSSGTGLLAIGAAGLLIGWAYSAPPLKLNSRGWGELCVALGFGLITLGADYVQRGAFSWTPVAATVSYALLVTNILYINQFPDRKADAAVGKRHWVARLELRQARWGYVLIALLAYGWLVAAVIMKFLPALTLVSLLAAALSLRAARDLLRFAAEPARLVPAIPLSIAAASLHGLLLAASLALSSGALR
jgi:1,4-dihydroxy-2-naphthoate octaprenyltransferase